MLSGTELLHETLDLEPEVEKALADATDLELTDLAAVLGNPFIYYLI